MVPLRRVEGRARERVPARDLREVRSVELADGGDHRRRGDLPDAPVSPMDLDVPRAGLVIPRGTGDLGGERDVLGDPATIHHRGEVGLQLRLPGEELGPLVARLEAVAVEVVPHVDASAGIRVLPPRATHPGVLLEDDEGDPGLLEADPGQQTRLAAPDDRHRRAIPGRPSGGAEGARIAAIELHLLHEHRHVLVGHRLADQPLHHLVDHLGSQRSGLRAAGVAVRDEQVERQGPSPFLVLLRQVPLDLVEEEPGRPEVATDDRRIPREVHQAEQQGRDAHILERFDDLRIACLERHPGMWVARHLSPSCAAVPLPGMRLTLYCLPSTHEEG